MYDFKRNLEKDEKILYEGRPNPGNLNKNLGGLIFVLVFVIAVQALLIWGFVTGTSAVAGGEKLSIVIVFIGTLLFEGLAIYGIVFNVFFAKKDLSDDYYCITNKRVLKYEEKKDQLIYGYLENYKDIHVEGSKKGYGDVYFSIEVEDDLDAREGLSIAKEVLFKPDKQNMPVILFQAVESPKKVAQIAKEARDRYK